MSLERPICLDVFVEVMLGLAFASCYSAVARKRSACSLLDRLLEVRHRIGYLFQMASSMSALSRFAVQNSKIWAVPYLCGCLGQKYPAVGKKVFSRSFWAFLYSLYLYYAGDYSAIPHHASPTYKLLCPPKTQAPTPTSTPYI